MVLDVRIGAATPSPAPPCVEGGSLGPEGCQLSLPEIEGLVPSMQLTHQDQGSSGLLIKICFICCFPGFSPMLAHWKNKTE